MANPKYPEEFREEAVRQITERGYSVKEVSARPGVSTRSQYNWLGGVRGNASARKGTAPRDGLEPPTW
jgi:transposase